MSQNDKEEPLNKETVIDCECEGGNQKTKSISLPDQQKLINNFAFGIGSIAKTQIQIHYSLPSIIILSGITWIVQLGIIEGLIYWAVSAAILIGSVLGHELGHVFATRHF
eukprot:715302_1